MIISIILGSTILINIFGNWLESVLSYFDFEIFSSYAPAITAIIAILVGYRQYLDSKVTENSKRLYEQELEKLKLEEQLFYEYFSSITQLYQIMSKSVATPVEFFLNLGNQYTEIFAIGDKLDTLTNISTYIRKSQCVACKLDSQDFLDILKVRQKIFELRYEIIHEIREEILLLQPFVLDRNNKVMQCQNMHNNAKLQSNIYVDTDKLYVDAIISFDQELNNANTKTQNNIGEIINTKVKQDFFSTYKTYNILQRQYIETKRKNNFRLNEQCEQCEYSKLTYKDIEHNLKELQQMRDLATIPQPKGE